jgi:hypothetical protein
VARRRFRRREAAGDGAEGDVARARSVSPDQQIHLPHEVFEAPAGSTGPVPERYAGSERSTLRHDHELLAAGALVSEGQVSGESKRLPVGPLQPYCP